MLKRTWAGAIAAIAIGAVALTGCGGGNGSEHEAGDELDGTGVTLDVYLMVNLSNPEGQQKWLDEVGARFTEETGAEVRWETYASANDLQTKIQTSVVAGQGPDLFGLGTTFTPTAYATGAFVTLGDEEWESIGGRDKFAPTTLGLSGPDEDNQIAIPMVTGPFVMAYNTEMFEQAGFDEPADSWDGLRDQAKALTGDGVYGFSVGYADGFAPWKYIFALDMQQGNRIVEGDTVTLDDESTRIAFETYHSWLTDDQVVDPASVGWNGAQALAAFAEGKAAMALMTVAQAAGTLNSSSVADSYTFAPMPTIPPGHTSLPAGGVGATSILAGSNLVVADYSDEQALTFELVRFLTDPQVQESMWTTLGDMPTNASVLANLPDPGFDTAPIIAALDGAAATPFTGAWADIQLAISDVAVQVLPELAAGGVSPETLGARLAIAQDAAQEAVNRAR